jgi:molybdopterin-containing oxidoreductase family iron-sulfur binding subunit
LREFGAEPPVDEFPPGSAEWAEGLNRRDFVRLAAASLALAGGACTRQPRETIVPYVKQPELLVPGKPLFYVTAMSVCGQVHGLLVRSREGRPVKIEGNPEHPATLGPSSVHMQSALLDLYEPTRSKSVLRNGQQASWPDFLGALFSETKKWKEADGAGLRLLTGDVRSPTLLAQIGRFLKKYPGAKWHRHEPAFARQPVETECDFKEADVIVSLDADFLGNGGARLRDAHGFAARRRKENGLNRLYVIESMPSLTGAMADHRRALSPRELGAFAQKLLAAIRDAGATGDAWADAVARDLRDHRGRSAVLAGDFQPPEVQAAARAINDALANTGKTVRYRARVDQLETAALPELAAEMHAGRVRALCIVDSNPVWTAPADLRFAEALLKVGFTAHLGSHVDETAARCGWHFGQSHFLESWSDLRSSDGVESIVQPLIEPLYATISPHDFLAALALEVPGTAYEIVRASWRQRYTHEADFESFWRRTLHDGFTKPNDTQTSPAPAPAPNTNTTPEHIGLELIVRPDPHLLDGRFRHNGWLQELPTPMTKLTWENAAHLSPRTAQTLKLEQGDIVELAYRGRKLLAPIWILPGHADDCVTIHLGHGGGDNEGQRGGFNAFALQTSDALWGGPGLDLRRTGRRHEFSTTQTHQDMAGRVPVRVDDPLDSREHEPPPRAAETLYGPPHYGRPAWGMAIDLATCIGCSACTIACQAENNIPAVGREQVLRGREMHWIRVDRYYEGDAHAPKILHQPVPCMHCENAPCEVVCPVAATVHDHDGLNLMVYNRCIGTRYCSNNCPYKVRRFNFLQYADQKTPQLALGRNPEVSVRMRGVMEKCTYCVQRIAAARIEADKENRTIADGEVVPACAQSCPADAIVFGDINDPGSRVAALRRDARHYQLLGELNTRPRTTYLAKTRNPNPEIPA